MLALYCCLSTLPWRVSATAHLKTQEGLCCFSPTTALRGNSAEHQDDLTIHQESSPHKKSRRVTSARAAWRGQYCSVPLCRNSSGQKTGYCLGFDNYLFIVFRIREKVEGCGSVGSAKSAEILERSLPSISTLRFALSILLPVTSIFKLNKVSGGA